MLAHSRWILSFLKISPCWLLSPQPAILFLTATPSAASSPYSFAPSGGLDPSWVLPARCDQAVRVSKVPQRAWGNRKDLQKEKEKLKPNNSPPNVKLCIGVPTGCLSAWPEPHTRNQHVPRTEPRLRCLDLSPAPLKNNLQRCSSVYSKDEHSCYYQSWASQ